MKVRLIPFSALTRVTWALGTTAFEESDTTPESVAVVVAICALMRGVLLTNKPGSIASPTRDLRNQALLTPFVFTMQPPNYECSLGVPVSELFELMPCSDRRRSEPLPPTL